MFKRLIAAGALTALALTPSAIVAQEADEAVETAEAAEAAPAAPRRFDPINYNLQEDRENILVLDLSNGKRVQLRLMEQWAPNHVQRIKTLARQGFYNGVIFHRVIDGFMAQTGDPTGTGQGGSQLPDLNEEFNPMPHIRGTVSMARAQSENSANSQFFITFYPRFSLDKRYTNLGRVISGMDGVDAIVRGEPPANPTKILQASIAADNLPVPAPEPVAPTTTEITPDMLSSPISQ
ncbi:peptidylprolyl isomerase [Pontixanthobacter aquaemixtae]|uniref:Peptidyl-prolyl cis-trans isomerase n=1 Tax=Pontixanthobacter aquaemixtae TaxID=1958940 RepID=A0A844ZQS0_9SPHN|nr:peptidylprolyl isomerase [Pontixanthobacter aquaemixtae]MXO90153.1 peptidylprolyl isomerase [Pontixanthobacter aquaemixtae]